MGIRLGVRLAYPASPNPLLALCTAHELARAGAVGVVPCVQEQPSQPDRSSNRRAAGGWRFAPSTADERMTTGSSVRVIADFPRVFSFQRMFALTCARARGTSRASALGIRDETIRWGYGIGYEKHPPTPRASSQVSFSCETCTALSRAQKGTRGTARATDLGDRRTDRSRSAPARAKSKSEDLSRAFRAAQG